MFSSNQVFKVSGNMDQLPETLEFALKYSNNQNRDLYFQQTDDGKFCLGWCNESGWTKFQFKFDVETLAKIIEQFLKEHKNSKKSPYEYCDGTLEDGFIMENIPETFADEEDGIKNPFYGFVYFKYYKNFYSK